MPKVNRKTSPIGLAQKQIWKMEGACVEIVQLGKRLIEYRMTGKLGRKTVRPQITAIHTMQDYLKAHKARLLKTGA